MTLCNFVFKIQSKLKCELFYISGAILHAIILQIIIVAHFVFAFQTSSGFVICLYFSNTLGGIPGQGFPLYTPCAAKKAGVICTCSTHPDLKAHYSPPWALHFSSTHLLAILPLAKYVPTLWPLHRSFFLQVANSLGPFKLRCHLPFPLRITLTALSNTVNSPPTVHSQSPRICCFFPHSV